MNIAVIILSFFVTQLAWANSEVVNTEEFKPIALEETASAEEPVQAATEIVEKPAVEAQAIKNLKESEIPVLTKTASQKVKNKNPWKRLFFSFSVIVIFAFGLFQTAKWWQRKAAVNTDSNKIRVLNQHYLGPRKSLAIIRVAGENILIGVTDNNITHIKTLSLLEGEDVPTEVPQNFEDELVKNGEKNEDESAWSSIRDRVSTKINEMRPL